MSNIKVIKTAHKLHYIFWANIYREVLHWTKVWDKASIILVKKIVKERLFSGIEFNSDCFACHGSLQDGRFIACRNCFLNLKPFCIIDFGSNYRSAWNHLIYVKTSREALPYVRCLRDAKINWNIDIDIVALNLRPVLHSILSQRKRS